jgi:hypothetical protein
MKNMKIGKSVLWSITFLIFASYFFYGCAAHVREKQLYDYDKMDSATRNIHKKVEAVLESCIEKNDPIKISRYTRIDSVVVNEVNEHADIYLNRFFAQMPLREENTAKFYDALNDQFGWLERDYSLTVYATNNRIEELIPNYYRSRPEKYDRTRLANPKDDNPPLLRNLDQPWQATKGLFNKYIALWHSHGWYYEPRLGRWEWQRARLFQSVEDLGPMGFTIPYIVPMLENAGANVFLPRERDPQINEVVIDNDSYSELNPYYLEKSSGDSSWWRKGSRPGFAIGNPPYGSWINPFKLGSYRWTLTSERPTAEINWIPQIPEDGKYAVYISYALSDSNSSDAHYTVYHTGGKTEFLVNQKMGGDTWIYLGEFIFHKGLNPDSGMVVLSNESKQPGKIVTADAVRFGGGMGNIIREGQISGRPRYIEAARYYLQYAGMPDTLVYTLSANKNDYTDDYKGRGEWVNYLKGAPFGPNGNRMEKGLGIPIDLSLAFHTDAGISPNDTVIGTLSIYCTLDAESLLVFPDSVSRFANRDFADILQTQIVEDIRFLHDPAWNRRGLWDRDYSEAFRPNVPAALLELLSHQNFLDMQFFLDPRFKFDVSRSIYKGILRFLAMQYQEPFVVQPLPVNNFSAQFRQPGEVYLQWKPSEDLLEKTAKPNGYIVYTRIENNGFDNGVLVRDSVFTKRNLIPGIIYSFKITAINDGGESFPSEILSVCWFEEDQDPVLIINGFDRISGPQIVDTETFKGFVNFLDSGVPDKYDLSYVGSQFNFTPNSKWSDDDSPGFGSSYADKETEIVPGNTFDFPFVHGEALRTLGISFISSSDEAIENGDININDYHIVDLILGEEKKTQGPKNENEIAFNVFSDSMQKRLGSFCNYGGNLFVSGAYVGTDVFKTLPVDSMTIKFARKVMKYFHRTNHAVKNGYIIVCDTVFRQIVKDIKFNTSDHNKIYTVEAPDAIEPADSLAYTIFRYRENNMSAAVAYNGAYKVVVFGFPFESIVEMENRNQTMRAIIEFFKSKHIKSTN